MSENDAIAQIILDSDYDDTAFGLPPGTWEAARAIEKENALCNASRGKRDRAVRGQHTDTMEAPLDGNKPTAYFSQPDEMGQWVYAIARYRWMLQTTCREIQAKGHDGLFWDAITFLWDDFMSDLAYHLKVNDLRVIDEFLQGVYPPPDRASVRTTGAAEGLPPTPQ